MYASKLSLFVKFSSLFPILVAVTMSFGCAPAVTTKPQAEMAVGKAIETAVTVDKSTEMAVAVGQTTDTGKAVGQAMDPEKAVEGAEKIYNDILLVSDAVEKYRIQHGDIPNDINPLVQSGLIVPSMVADLGGGTYAFHKLFDDMDGQGDWDSAIYTTADAPPEVCAEFNRRYAAAPLNDGTVFDYQAAGKKYPGQVFGRDHKVFAIKWETAQAGCEINWVIEYR